MHQALENHALCVWGGSQELITRVIILSDRYKESDAKIHLRFGLGRRARTIWQSFRYLYINIPPNRTAPLTTDDAVDASTMLNSLYINIRGALDNFALCLQDLLASDEQSKLELNKIGLFNKSFLKQPGFERIKDIVTPFKVWDLDFKSRRDPAAHRVPLSLIPAIHDAKSLADFQLLEDQIGKLWRGADVSSRSKDYNDAESKYADIELLRGKQEKLGKFEACFQYDPKEHPIYLYPTISTDVGTFVILARKLLEFIEELPLK